MVLKKGFTVQTVEDGYDNRSVTVFEGTEDPEQAGERLYQTVIDIASGTLSRNETMAYNEPIDLYLEGPRF